MSTRSISVQARQRLRAQQDAEARAVAAHGAAVGRLATTTAKRAEAIAAQDELVAQVEGQVAATAAGVVEVSGLERAAAILGVPKGVLRRQLASARRAQGSAS